MSNHIEQLSKETICSIEKLKAALSDRHTSELRALDRCIAVIMDGVSEQPAIAEPEHIEPAVTITTELPPLKVIKPDLSDAVKVAGNDSPNLPITHAIRAIERMLPAEFDAHLVHSKLKEVYPQSVAHKDYKYIQTMLATFQRQGRYELVHPAKSGHGGHPTVYRIKAKSATPEPMVAPQLNTEPPRTELKPAAVAFNPNVPSLVVIQRRIKELREKRASVAAQHDALTSGSSIKGELLKRIEEFDAMLIEWERKERLALRGEGQSKEAA